MEYDCIMLKVKNWCWCVEDDDEEEFVKVVLLEKELVKSVFNKWKDVKKIIMVVKLLGLKLLSFVGDEEEGDGDGDGS